LEDYLEAIFNLSEQGVPARVKDIAKNMQVTMPSVNGAVRSLASKGLVEHKPYESIALTQEGTRKARGIADRHAAVKQFLVDVLRIDPADAETEACGLEHAIREDTLERLVAFVRDFRGNGDTACEIDDTLIDSIDEDLPTCEFVPETETTLDQLCPGRSGTIISLAGRGVYRKRLMEMGLGPGADFEVLRIAPLGDPVEVKVRGYLLSLRKSEAALINVRILE
jgi:DtxR family Mn-dependent transcriptional regulator